MQAAKYSNPIIVSMYKHSHTADALQCSRCKGLVVHKGKDREPRWMWHFINCPTIKLLSSKEKKILRDTFVVTFNSLDLPGRELLL